MSNQSFIGENKNRRIIFLVLKQTNDYKKGQISEDELGTAVRVGVSQLTDTENS